MHIEHKAKGKQRICITIIPAGKKHAREKQEVLVERGETFIIQFLPISKSRLRRKTMLQVLKEHGKVMDGFGVAELAYGNGEAK